MLTSKSDSLLKSYKEAQLFLSVSNSGFSYLFLTGAIKIEKPGVLVSLSLSFFKRPISYFFDAVCFLDFLIKLSMFDQKGKTIRCFSLL